MNKIKNSIPNIFTLSNLFFGFLSIMFSAQGDYKNAAILILIGMMLDSLDGRLARMLNVISDFGKELDSLADIVTFGVAPAMMVYYIYFQDFGVIGMCLAGLFPLFGAFRLARFNINAEKNPLHFFTGVPITAAGGILTMLTLFHNYIPEAVILIAFFMFCLLMVSKIKIPSFKEIPLPKYGTIITLFLGYVVYMLSKGMYEDFPYLVYVAVALYVFFFGYQFRKKRNTSKTENHE